MPTATTAPRTTAASPTTGAGTRTVTVALAPTATLTARGIMVTDRLRALDGRTIEMPLPFAGDHLHDTYRCESDTIRAAVSSIVGDNVRIDWDGRKRAGYVTVNGREVGTVTATVDMDSDIEAVLRAVTA